MIGRCSLRVKSTARRGVSDITLRRKAAIGDAIWATSIFRALSKRAADRGGKLYFSTSVPGEFFEGNAWLTGGVVGAEVFGELIDLTDSYEKTPNLHPVLCYARDAGLSDSDIDPPYIPVLDHKHTGAIVIHPATSWQNRTLSAEFWQSLMVALKDTFPHREVVLIGTKAELSRIEVNTPKVSGSWSAIRRVIAGAGVFIGSDSGPLQIAAASDVPAIGLYTCALGELRRPLKSIVPFVAVETSAECRGCLHRQPAPVRFYDCDFTDDSRFKCRDMFSVSKIAEIAREIVV